MFRYPIERDRVLASGLSVWESLCKSDDENCYTTINIPIIQKTMEAGLPKQALHSSHPRILRLKTPDSAESHMRKDASLARQRSRNSGKIFEPKDAAP